MSCRSTRASSASVTLARTLSGLEDAQVTSLFHELKRHAKEEGVAAPTSQEYLAGLDQLALRVRTSAELSDGMRERLLERVDAARHDDPLDATAWYATTHILAQSDIAAGRLSEIAGSAAPDLLMRPASVRELVDGWRAAPTDSYEDTASPDLAFRYDLDARVPHDPATARALRKLGYEQFLAQPYPVFVYGTLRSGQGNDRLMTGAVESLSEARLDGVAVYGAHRGFPYAKEHDDPQARVVGEVVWLSPDVNGLRARGSLDGLEGFYSDFPSDSHYERVLREVTYTDAEGREQTTKAWTYLARGVYARQLQESDRIEHGDWVAARSAYREPRPRYSLWGDDESNWIVGA